MKIDSTEPDSNKRSPYNFCHSLNASYHLLLGKLNRFPKRKCRSGPGGSFTPAPALRARKAGDLRTRQTITKQAIPNESNTVFEMLSVMKSIMTVERGTGDISL